MNSTLSNQFLDLNFECALAGGVRAQHPEMRHLALETITTVAQRSTPGTISAANGLNVLGMNLEGSIIARSTKHPRVMIVPPKSMFYVRGPVRLSALAAKGDHRISMLTWSTQLLPTLDMWIQSLDVNQSSRGFVRNLGCKPIMPNFNEVIRRYEEATGQSKELIEPLLFSVIFESVGRIMVGGDQMQLASLPVDLPEIMKKLTDAVRLDPTGNWPLKEASDMASYSPFHFSRVFKQFVGYGFHEYVDRCRTEVAVEMLVTTDVAVDSVATAAGFGTTQGLRESVREYLGLLPSDFRSLPEIAD